MVESLVPCLCTPALLRQSYVRNRLLLVVDRNKVTYPLLDRNLRVVTGRNKDEAASDSNGSGKTALVNGPLWAFTGRTDARAEVHYICANTGCCAVLHIVVIERQQRYMLSSIPIIQFPAHRRSIRLHAIFRLASSSRHCLENQKSVTFWGLHTRTSIGVQACYL